ncbi:hypothetical protein CU097_015521 [Rhizopus azygosporus]|uniref:Survival motor neuron Tudor domain-containing protein n=1 Tax=Rhizopus azygosporus TaxID=86630 RepID=A0A367KAB8_RHIAZ|nr:hypothetical protein CU097_015521 [Rhizopus azygosporus]
MSIKVPDTWDSDIIEYWDALLKSYKTCHEQPASFDTFEKVTQSIMDNLPKETLKQQEEEPRKRQKTKEDQLSNKKVHFKDQYEGQEEEQYEQEEEQYEQEEEEEYEQEKEQYDQEEEQYDQGEQEKQAENINEQTQYDYSIPSPPPVSAGDDDGLSNVIMAWYYAGYYTALYQSRHGSRSQ